MATKLRNIFLFIILISVILSGKTNIVSASEGTTYTYTISVDGDYIRTQEAYLASTVICRDKGWYSQVICLYTGKRYLLQIQEIKES